MTRISPTRFERLLVLEIADQNSGRAVDEILDADAASRTAGVTLFLRNILDHIADHEFRHGEQSFVRSCEAAAARLAQSTDPVQPEITGLLALIRLNVILLDRRFQAPDPQKQEETDQYCRHLFTETSVGSAIGAVYRPANTAARRFWDQLDFGELRYHKAGTTSFIMIGFGRDPITQTGVREKLAVKCVLFPWNKLASIALSTGEYATKYAAERTTEVVVHPIASTDRWILMPFQEGQTLREYLTEFENSGDVTPGMRIKKAREIAAGLTRALHRLADGRPIGSLDPPRQHLDLSASNVILIPHSNDIRFIDLGINHLYSRQVGIAEHDDSVYIAPEIKNRSPDTAVADFYSLGVILIQVLCGYAPRNGRVPSEVWEMSPLLGRALEDLTEEDHHNRLLLHSGDPVSFERFGRFLDITFKLALDEPGASKSGMQRQLARLLPTSREVKTQFSQWRSTKATATVRYASYLLFFSLLATACWWFIVAKTALAKLDDVFTFQFEPLPRGDELAATVVAFAQGLLGAKFYQTMLARVTTRGIPGTLATVTEWCVRYMSIVPLLTTILAVFWKPSLWAWTSAAGALAVAVTNLLAWTLTKRIHQAGIGQLSSVRPGGEVSSHGFDQWWWTMLLYALMVGIIAYGLQTGWLRDSGAYVFGLVLITVGIHYISKCTFAGPAIRGELARSFAIGERLGILHARGDRDIPGWPPHLRQRQRSIRGSHLPARESEMRSVG